MEGRNMESVNASESVFDVMNKYTLRFYDESLEQRFLLANEPMRIFQMRFALIITSFLYAVLATIDYNVLPMPVQELGTSIHLFNSVVIMVFAALLFKASSYNTRTAIVMVAVTITWLDHIYFVNSSGIHTGFEEFYLQLIWVWILSGLIMRQAAKLIFVLLLIFEIVIYFNPTFVSPDSIVHQFFILVSIIIGGLGAYLTELYKRKNFLSLERVSDQKEQLVKEADKLDRLSQALKQSGDAILITDNEAVVEYVNTTFLKLTGYSSEELIGKSPKELNCVDRDIDIQDVMREVAQEGTWDSLIRAHRKDGSTYPALLSAAPVYDNAGAITHYIYSHKDMTEHQRMENQLRNSQQMDAIGTLVGGIAHDFNNNLAGITGNMYLLKRTVADNPEALAMIDTMNKLAYSTAKTVKQLLAYTRRGILDFDTFDFSKMVNHQMALLRADLPSTIELSYEHISAEPLLVRGDSNLLLNAFVNLLNNARDAVANAKYPKIKVSIEKWTADKGFKRRNPDINEKSFVRVCIEDNGCGIDAEVLPRIFEPFFTTKDVDKGTGLGLSMVIGAVQSHHGVIEVRSKAGRGATFYVYLPLSETDNTTKSNDKNGEDVVFASAQNTVLVVDDNAEVLRVVSALMSQLGYEVIQAKDGLEAVEIFDERHDEISLVILDIVMPKMNGIEVKKVIKEKKAQVKVLFLTGYDPDQHENHEELQSEEVMMKPFRVSELSQKVKELLSS